jgi:hypothetical protein
VFENGAAIQCPGLFVGEFLVMVEHSRKSIIITMNASHPDTEYILAIFEEVIEKKFTQCIHLSCQSTFYFV